tara:strand:+ start:503 stop:1207 length:705 start_codon:yes stop_codon:yes gene_type:complete
MKAVILAGGRGSRISFYTHKIPKPMVKIGNKPMLIHIIDIFMYYGIKDILIAAGYKSKIIKSFFSKNIKYQNVKVVNTGINSMTGDRIAKLKNYLKKEDNFLLTYGDGVCNLNINRLIKFHLKHGKIATVTAVRPTVKFGEINIGKNNSVDKFIEKPQLDRGWINGGFFVFNKNIFKYLKGNKITLEKNPLIKLSSENELKAFKHAGYWRCMDNLNEKNNLETIFKEYNTIWNF